MTRKPLLLDRRDRVFGVDAARVDANRGRSAEYLPERQFVSAGDEVPECLIEAGGDRGDEPFLTCLDRLHAEQPVDPPLGLGRLLDRHACEERRDHVLQEERPVLGHERREVAPDLAPAASTWSRSPTSTISAGRSRSDPNDVTTGRSASAR